MDKCFSENANEWGYWLGGMSYHSMVIQLLRIEF